MKQSIIIIIVVIAAIVALLFLKKDEVIAPTESDSPIETETTSSLPTTETLPVVTPSPSTTSGTQSYSYTNDEFGFAVKLPGLVATQKADIPYYIDAVFTFGVGDQSNVTEEKRIPNTMAVYIWNNKPEFENMIFDAESLGKETVNGKTYDIYSFTLEDTTTYRYTTTIGDRIYDVGVRNRSDAKKFFFID